MTPFPSPPDYFDEPPSYEGTIYSPVVPSPLYSSSPGASEVLVRTSTDSEATCASSEHHKYRSKHITADLGLRLWGTSVPVYGEGGFVEGSFALTDDPKNVSSVCVKLEGTVVNTYTERGLITGSSSVSVLESSLTFTSSPSGEWAEEQPFSIQFPRIVSGTGTPLPPSSILFHPGVTCRVGYRLKVSLMRKKFHRNESVKITLLYLPRTFARVPLVSSLPTILSGPCPLQPEFDSFQDAHTIPLRASKKSWTKQDCPSIFLSLPSILSFASYDIIPVRLHVVTSQNAAVKDLLLASAKVWLVKRTRTWINGGKTSREHDSLFGEARVVDPVEDPDNLESGSRTFTLRAKQPSKQRTWSVPGVAEQQYYVRVTISPPPSTALYLPKYECEQLIEITTDAYESSEREVSLAGGLPSPAVESLARYDGVPPPVDGPHMSAFPFGMSL